MCVWCLRQVPVLFFLTRMHGTACSLLSVNPYKDASSCSPLLCVGYAPQGQLCALGLGAEPVRELIAE